jgi:hypothetical protein
LTVKLTIVSIDSQRRIYIPKELGFKAEKALMIPRGQNYLLIPIPDEITPIDTQLTIKELKEKGKEKARRETKEC